MTFLKSFSFRVAYIFLTVFLFLFMLFPADSCADYAVIGDDNEYEIYTDEPEPERQVTDAEATLASLFGKNATIAIPPQIAGGTIALPSFDSKDLKIEKMEVSED
jgi:hypothetical protein